MLIRIGNVFDSGSGMENFGSGIWDKHPGSATLLQTNSLGDLSQILLISVIKWER
jgi:hypothetical protein